MDRVQFTGSQESILHMEIDEVVSRDSGSPRTVGAVSPLPQIRASITQRQLSLESSLDGDSGHSSRASTPDELTPSLPYRAARQELCVSCIAAAAAAAALATGGPPEPLPGSAPTTPDSPSSADSSKCADS